MTFSPHRPVTLRAAGLVIAPVLAVLCSTALAAQPPRPRFELRLDFARPTYDSSVRLDARQLGIGTELDLEGELGLDDQSEQLTGGAILHLGRRSRLAFDYSASDREGSAVVGREIRFGNVVYRADARLDAAMESRFAALGYGFDFLPEDEVDFGATLSVAWTRLAATLRGDANLQGGPAIVIEERGEAEGPLPMLGLWASGWIGDRWRLGADVRFLDVNELDGWSGSVVDYAARVEWFALPQLAIALGYGGTRIEATFDDADDLGRADFSSVGPRLGVTLAF